MVVLIILSSDVDWKYVYEESITRLVLSSEAQSQECFEAETASEPKAKSTQVEFFTKADLQTLTRIRFPLLYSYCL